MNFNEVSKKYAGIASIQKDASNILFDLLNIKNNESVLDAGCGSGSLTKIIREKTNGIITGIDPSKGMIDEAIKNYSKDKIEFVVLNTEDIAYDNCFDVIFCNSAFMWFKDHKKVLNGFYKALRNGGRIGIQAPAKTVYCPIFVKAVKQVSIDEKTKKFYKHLKHPLLFLNSAGAYKKMFEKAGFKVVFAKIQKINSKKTPEDVYKIFSSGAIVSYLNQDFYEIKITEEYINDFKNIIRNEFEKQKGKDGFVNLLFNRIYLTGIK
jgi:ubiquinone/menaquinone biosynthesis C-methylase UbiE